jgi:hypothetical protein
MKFPLKLIHNLILEVGLRSWTQISVAPPAVVEVTKISLGVNQVAGDMDQRGQRNLEYRRSTRRWRMLHVDHRCVVRQQSESGGGWTVRTPRISPNCIASTS